VDAVVALARELAASGASVVAVLELPVAALVSAFEVLVLMMTVAVVLVFVSVFCAPAVTQGSASVSSDL
jgi:hypothetical protein